ncbi:MAG: tRNA (adenosine(37)-N6)-dimethylallyltransferase MiaA [Flavobacteriaceae bacterium]
MPFIATTVDINSMKTSKLLYVAGPTASGKTSLAIELAQYFQTEIVSCDSRQFYHEMHIGTAVPSKEELAQAPHHFIQHRSIHEDYSVGDYRRDVLNLLKELFQQHETVILVGGSGLYADALIQGLDEFPEVDPAIRPQLTAIYEQEGIEVLQDLLREHDLRHYHVVDKNNPHRLIRALEISLSCGKPYSSFLGKKQAPDFFSAQTLIIDWEREALYERINQRVDQMVAQGLKGEAKALYPHKKLNALQTVGYREWFAHFDGKWDEATAIEEIKKNSRRYAKRQSTWFRRYENAHRIKGGTTANEIIPTLL